MPHVINGQTTVTESQVAENVASSAEKQKITGGRPSDISTNAIKDIEVPSITPPEGVYTPQPRVEAQSVVRPASILEQAPTGSLRNISEQVSARSGQPIAPVETATMQSQAPGNLAQPVNRQVQRNIAAGDYSTDPNNAGPGVDIQPEQPAFVDNSIPFSVNSPVSGTSEGRTSIPTTRKQEANQASASQESALKTVAQRVDNSQPGVSERAVVEPGKRTPQLYDFGRTVFKPIADKISNSAAMSHARKWFLGDAVRDKIFGDPSIRPNEVSVGSELLQDMLRGPNNLWLDRLQQELGIQLDPATVNVERDIMPLVNDRSVSIWVGLSKGPINRGSSAQQRILRIHSSSGGRGIKVHPTQMKAYNADFDGDEVDVNFDKEKLYRYKSAMSYLIDIDGSVTIEEDFFPLIVMSDTAPYRGFIKDDVLSWYPDGELKDAITNALIALSRNTDKDKTTELRQQFVQSLANAGNPYGNNADTVTSNLLNSIYQGMSDIKRIRMEANADLLGESEYIAPKSDTVEWGLEVIITEMVMGRTPNNFQDFKNTLSKYIYEINGKNVSFRLSADLAKIIKWNDKIKIGSDFLVKGQEDLFELYTHTMSAGYSMRMSNAITLGERNLFRAERLRFDIISEAKLPHYYQMPNGRTDYKAWLQAFVEAYRKVDRRLEVASDGVLTNMMFDQFGNGKRLMKKLESDSMSNVVTALIDVYGRYSMGYLFQDMTGWTTKNAAIAELGEGYGKVDRKVVSSKNNALALIHARYKEMTLSEFSKRNILKFDQKQATNANRKNLSSYNNQIDLLVDIFTLAADKKTSKASKYNMDFRGKAEDAQGNSIPDSENKDTVLYRMLETVKEINSLIKGDEKSRDWARFCDTMFASLCQVDPNMFAYFNMSSPDLFFKSERGQELLKARNIEEIGGVYLSMYTEYRMGRSDKLNKAFREMRNSETSTIADVESACAKYTMELDELASSSDAWDAIVKEIRSNKKNRAFDAIKAASTLKEVNDRFQVNISQLYYKGWATDNHGSLLELMLDSSVLYTDKTKALADVTRCHSMNEFTLAFSMPYQLKQSSDETFAQVGMSKEDSVFDLLDTANKSFNKYYNRSFKASKKNVDEAYKEFGKSERALSNTLKMMVDDPTFLIEVDDQIYADALLAPMDKVFANSEKGSQHPMVNALYQALSIFRNGSIYSDVYRTDNRALGIVGNDQLTLKDLVWILSDADNKLPVYDEYGNVDIVTRESLTGGRDEASLWQFFRDNPSLSMCIRSHRTNVMQTDKVKSFLSAKKSMKETIQEANSGKGSNRLLNAVKYEMRDHPRFGGMLAMFAPVAGNVSRNLRQQMIANENQMIARIINLASMKMEAEKENALPAIENYLEHTLGITEDSLVAAGMAREAAIELHAELIDNFDRYSDQVIEIANKMGAGPLSLGKLSDFRSVPSFDLASIAMYYDVRQELSGAKTAASTGVEGQETYNLAFWTSLLFPKDEYANLGMFDTDTIAKNLIGCTTASGVVITEQNTDQVLLDTKEEKDLIIKVPPGFKIPDLTTDSYGQQISSLGRYLIIHRDKGAEEFNLKVKKTGDDGTDSITKHSKYTGSIVGADGVERTMYDHVCTMVNDAYSKTEGTDEQRMLAAKIALAQHLKEQNEAIGYDDMDLANYVNIADAMILFDHSADPNNATVYIRSIEQFATAIKNRIGVDVLDEGSLSDMSNEARAIANTVGIQPIANHTALFYNLPIHGVSDFSPMLSVRSSSVERKLDLVEQIESELKAEGISYQMLNGSEMKRAEQQVAEKYPKMAESFSKIETLNKFHFLGVLGGMTVNTVGHSAAYIMSDPNVSLDTAKKLGATVFVRSDVDLSQSEENSKYLADMIPIPNTNLYMIPFFEMRLNGYYGDGSFRGTSASYQAVREQFTVSFEDTTGEYAFGDSLCQVFNYFMDRLKVAWNDTHRTQSSDLFANVFRTYEKDDATFSVRRASAQEIEKFILNQSEPYAIDYGMSLSNKNFEQEKARMDKRIDEFRKNRANLDDSGTFMTQGKPDQIITWAICDIQIPGKPVQHVFAPVIPWQAGTDGRRPSDFEITSCGYNEATSSFDLQWSYNGDPKRSYFKVHEGVGAANKMMATGDSVDGGQLKNGVSLDMAYSNKTTESRRLGTNKRISTIVSMMFMARWEPYGFNFAEREDAFPNDPGLAEELRATRIPIERWVDLTANGEMDLVFLAGNNKMNAFLNQQVRRCLQMNVNPSDFLASRFDKRNHGWVFEFESVMDTSEAFQDNLMEFYNMMMPTLCPSSIDGDWSTCLFRPSKEAGFNYGCLQMQVPHRSAVDGGTYYVWENVYVGPTFVGKDYSGFSKPSTNASSAFMDHSNSLALSGMMPRGTDRKQLIQWVSSERERTNTLGSVNLDLEKMIFEEDEIDGNNARK